MKKLIVLLIMFLPLGAFSQELKVAVVNAGEVFNMMPELSEAETLFANFSAQYQNEINAMQEEYTLKYQDYMKIQETLTENLKLRRQQELQELGTRIENTYQVFQEDSEKEREKLMAPIQEKLQKAIKEVGDEQGYTMMFNVQSLLYTGKSAIDATPLVKAKLGLR